MRYISCKHDLGNVHFVHEDCYELINSYHKREGEDADQIVSKHIKLLHQYNEAKDAAQVRSQVETTEQSMLTATDSRFALDSDW